MLKFLAALSFASLFALWGCTADGSPVTIEPMEKPSLPVSSSSATVLNSSSSFESDSSAGNIFTGYLDMVKIPESKLLRGSALYAVDSFMISATEVTQGTYSKVMGRLIEQPRVGDSLPVVNINWYEAALFSNALSKKIGLDTVYRYASVGLENYLENLTVDFFANGVRLPSEIEWEIAARAGTQSKYYWGVSEASDFANYGQTNKGAVKVASYKPNAFKLFDMAGNVAEWANDWYGALSVESEKNPVGPSSGKTKVIRGGSWADKVSALASSERASKDPLYKSEMLGFRVVYRKLE